RRDFVRAAGNLIGARQNADEIAKFLQQAARLKNPEHALEGVVRGLDLSRTTGLKVPESAVRGYLGGKTDEQRRLAWSIASHLAATTLFEEAGKAAFDEKQSVENRAAALTALRGAKFETAFPVLQKVLDTNQAAILQASAVDTLSN